MEIRKLEVFTFIVKTNEHRVFEVEGVHHKHAMMKAERHLRPREYVEVLAKKQN